MDMTKKKNTQKTSLPQCLVYNCAFYLITYSSNHSQFTRLIFWLKATQYETQKSRWKPKIKSVASVDFTFGICSTTEVSPATPTNIKKKIKPPLGVLLGTAAFQESQTCCRMKEENQNEYSQYVLKLNKLLAFVNALKDTPTKRLKTGANLFIREKREGTEGTGKP